MGSTGAAGAVWLALLFSSFYCCCCCWFSLADIVPARYDDGFAYEVGAPRQEYSLVVEAFFDPLSPLSRDSWPPLKQILHDYAPRVFLVVHPFPLPYNDTSFLSCCALHIANKLNASTTYPLLELFFKYQEYFNRPTRKMTRVSVIGHMISLAAMAVGSSSVVSAFEKGYEDPEIDSAARTSFNYGCSKGVTFSPVLFINGVSWHGAVYYDRLRGIMDSLLNGGS